MRHFSGEICGLRLLMEDELDLIAGGEGEDTDDVPPPPPEQVDEIVVTGHRVKTDYDVGQLFRFLGTGDSLSGGNYGGDDGNNSNNNNNEKDCRQTQIEYDQSAVDNFGDSALATKFSNAIEQQSDRMRGMPAGLTITAPGGGTFTTGTELKALWSKADFTVTGVVPAAGYGGAAAANGGNPQLAVYADYLDDYMLNDTTEAWYFFHEIAHTTASGVAMNKAAYQAWVANPGGVTYANSTYFADNERVMNTVAANIASQFGYNLRANYSNVAFGYLSTGYEVGGTSGSITPDTAGSGPGGTC